MTYYLTDTLSPEAQAKMEEKARLWREGISTTMPLDKFIEIQQKLERNKITLD